MARLRKNKVSEVAILGFDRKLEISRNVERSTPRKTEVLFVEGNYLLLAPLGSRALVSLFDLTLMLEVEPRELKRRLVQRWRNLEIPEESILGREGGKNLPNGKTILQNSCDADVTIELRESNSP